MHIYQIQDIKNKKIKKNTSNKNLRRHLKRLAKSKSISYEEAILHFYKIKKLSQLDKNLLYSLHKNYFKKNKKNV